MTHQPAQNAPQHRSLAQHVARAWDLWMWPVIQKVLEVAVVLLFIMAILLSARDFFG